MRAFVLCAGLASRLRPFTLNRAKSVIPFLNLPLSLFSLIHLRRLSVNQICFNTHTSPQDMKSKILKYQGADQKFQFVYEKTPLGSAGGLYNIKNFWAEKESLYYLNGDSLFFPSDLKSFSKFKCLPDEQARFYAIPLPACSNNVEALFIDTSYRIRWIGNKQGALKRGFALDDPSKKNYLKPVYFTGFAHLSFDFLKKINSSQPHIFKDVILNLLDSHVFRVHLDLNGRAFEAGVKEDYLNTTKKILNLFYLKKEPVYSGLKQVFEYFDPEGEYVDLKKSTEFYDTHKIPVILPRNIDINAIEFKDFAVIGPDARFKKNIKIQSSVIWQGSFEENIENQLSL